MRAPPTALVVLVAALWLAFSAPLAAAEPDEAGQRLREVEHAIERDRRQRETLARQAADVQAELARLRRDAVAAAAAVQDSESDILGLEADLADLSAAVADKEKALAGERDRAARVLMALQRLARHPPQAILVRAAPLADTVRGAILLRTALPAIERDARRLRDDLTGLSAARAAIDDKLRTLVRTTAALERERTRLGEVLRAREAVRSRIASESELAERRLAALAREAEDLRDLLDRIEGAGSEPAGGGRAAETVGEASAARPAPPTKPSGRSIVARQGHLAVPAIGRLTGIYGQALEGGMTRKGLVIEAPSGAQVVAPFEGVVVFAGPFRGYGLLLIIDHGEGYHTLLAGLGRIDTTLGQTVVSGEPVGIMASADGDKPALYVELRRNGQPINPLPWLAANRSKVSG